VIRERPGVSRDRTVSAVSAGTPVTGPSTPPEGLETAALVVRAVGGTCGVFVARPGNTEVLFDGLLARGQVARYDLPRLDVVVRDAGACRVWINGVQEPGGRPGERKNYSVGER
jgi:hypothetical protein